MNEFYILTADKAMQALKTFSSGLSQREAKNRLERYGYNQVVREKRAAIPVIFLNQFRNTFILLLIFAGLSSLLLRQTLEALSIGGIVILNAILGFVQDYRAEKAIEELKKMAAPTARVLRDGVQQKIAASAIVPGDMLLFEMGDIVAADARIIEAINLQIDEASLTGESIPSKKLVIPFKAGTSIADQENMAFSGTTVVYGRGIAAVTCTGMNTELGKIAGSLQKTKQAKTPLQAKFSQLAKQIGVGTICLIIIVFFAGLLQGTLSIGKMLLLSMVLTVSTLPNSLPLVVTVGLSLGAKKLAKQGMLIKSLPAAESLGAATIICSDKTGTITKNQMTVTDIYCDGKQIQISGAGYTPSGKFYFNSAQINPKQIEMLLRIGCLCNNARIAKKKRGYYAVGDPTEAALLTLGAKGQLDESGLSKRFLRVGELPFDSDRKRMSVIYLNKTNNRREAYVKGAPDLLLSACSKIIENGKLRSITLHDKKRIASLTDDYAKRALRVLGLAYREVPLSREYTIKSVEQNLVFVGVVGMMDPPRDEIKEAVKQCREAGIKVMLITGDHLLTTKAVAHQIGLLKKGDIAITGDDLDRMSNRELLKKINRIRIIARAMPIQKLRVVCALQKKGHIVAMTGDGVNDAPALKKADIGIAMGITGTDVAKEVSKAVLVDDNFATIINAIGVGRNIYDKITKSARYLLSCNAGELTAIFIAILLKLPLPLLPLQILLMSLLTDDLPALGLGSERAEADVMKRPPRTPKAAPLSKRMLQLIIIFGLVMGAGTLAIFYYYLNTTGVARAQTVAFTTLVMFQMFAVISSRSLHFSLNALNPLSNKWLSGGVIASLLIQIAVIYLAPLQLIFGTVPLTGIDWLRSLGIASIGFAMMEFSKVCVRVKRND